MKRLLLLVPAVILTGCLASGITEDDLDSRFDPAQRLSPTAFEQNATMKDTSVHEDPSLMRVGVTRDQIAAAFGKPNETSDQTGRGAGRVRVQSRRFEIREAESLCAQYRGRRVHRPISRPSCTRRGFMRPSSSSRSIASTTGRMESCSPCRRNRARMTRMPAALNRRRILETACRSVNGSRSWRSSGCRSEFRSRPPRIYPESWNRFA